MRHDEIGVDGDGGGDGGGDGDDRWIVVSISWEVYVVSVFISSDVLKTFR